MNKRAALVRLVSPASRVFLVALFLFLSLPVMAQSFSCPAGTVDVMKYFALTVQARQNQFMKGSPNPIYTQVFPNQDFAKSGYWFWLKSPHAHGFDVKAFDQFYVYMRATELNWTDNTSFKRFVSDLPIAARCIASGKPGPTIRVPSTTFKYYGSCRSYKSSNLGTAVNDLDAPVQMDAGGNIGKVWTRVLHYRYDCDKNFQHCQDEEQFFLANGYGLWKWKKRKNGATRKTAKMNDRQFGVATGTLPCMNSYQ